MLPCPRLGGGAQTGDRFCAILCFIIAGTKSGTTTPSTRSTLTPQRRREVRRGRTPSLSLGALTPGTPRPRTQSDSRVADGGAAWFDETKRVGSGIHENAATGKEGRLGRTNGRCDRRHRACRRMRRYARRRLLSDDSGKRSGPGRRTRAATGHKRRSSTGWCHRRRGRGPRAGQKRRHPAG